MSVIAGTHADTQPLSALVGDNMRMAGNVVGYGLLTNTNVAAADTVAGLVSAIDTAAAASHADVRPTAARFDLAVSLGSQIGDFTNARILGLTTVQELIELTYGQYDSAVGQVPE